MNFSTKKIVFTNLLVICLVFFIFPLASLAEELTPSNYTPLAPLPGTTVTVGGEEVAELNTYIPGIFRLTIAIAGALAIIMIVVGGVEYLSTDAISGKTEGKSKITNALIGLLLAISAFIILNTINPQILNFDLSIKRPPEILPPPPISGDTCMAINPTTKELSSVSCSCVDCETIGLAQNNPRHILPLKPGAGNLLSKTSAEMLEEFKDEMFVLGYDHTEWWITEAWKPTTGHISICHIRGNCADVNLVPAPDLSLPLKPEEIKRVKDFFTAASKAGITSLQMEVPDNAIAPLQAAGVTGRLSPLPPQATGIHFHMNL